MVAQISILFSFRPKSLPPSNIIMCSISLHLLESITYALLLGMLDTSLPPPPTNYRKEEKKILDKLFSPAVYDSAIRPKGVSENITDDDDGPTKVLVNVFVRSFEKIDDVKMEFSFQITFRQQWNDNRLGYNDMGGRMKYLTMTDRGKVWMPDTFFRNEKEGKFHNIIQPNLYVRVFPNGDVLYSIRVSVFLIYVEVYCLFVSLLV